MARYQCKICGAQVNTAGHAFADIPHDCPGSPANLHKRLEIMEATAATTHRRLVRLEAAQAADPITDILGDVEAFQELREKAAKWDALRAALGEEGHV